MTLVERLGVGMNMSILGIGLVFLLLGLLWAILTVMLRLDREPAADNGSAAASVASPARAPASDVCAAIAMAVVRHRAVLRKQAAPAMRSHWPGSILFASRWVGAGRHQQTQSWHPRKR